MTDTKFELRRLGPQDAPLLEALSTLFGDVFDEVDTYTGARPSSEYLERLLAGPTFITLVALDGEVVIGGLAAYELPKFEQERSEIYIYDLGVAASHRRRGVATALLRRLTEIAADRGAHVVFVQADQGDDPATALYTKLGTREDVLHFDLDMPEPDAG
ncbi:MAG: AAC(3)-I family aminoglycoside N-acetyltransferase [Acidobacteriota bacterium]